MVKHFCGSCRFFEDANLAGSGWCHHPQRKTTSDLLIMVRRNELACRDEWSHSLWEPGDFAKPEPAATNRRLAPASEAEIAALIKTQGVSHGLQDVVLDEARIISDAAFWSPLKASATTEPLASPQSSILDLGTRAAIKRARETYRERSKARLKEAADTEAITGHTEPSGIETHGQNSPGSPPNADLPPAFENEPVPRLEAEPVGDEEDVEPLVPPSFRDAEADEPPRRSEMDRATGPEWSSLPSERERDERPEEEIPTPDDEAAAGDSASQRSADVPPAGSIDDDDTYAAGEPDVGLSDAWRDEDPFGDWTNRPPVPGEVDRLSDQLPRETEIVPVAQRRPETPWSVASVTEDQASLESPLRWDDADADGGSPSASDRAESVAEVWNAAEREDEGWSWAATGDRGWTHTTHEAVDQVFADPELHAESDELMFGVTDAAISTDLDEPPLADAAHGPDRGGIALIASGGPHLCRACRSYRPGEGGERGWCANQWAFTHHRLVEPDDPEPCETSVGSWWLPSDDECLTAADVSSHGRPTPLLDRWLPHHREQAATRRRS